MSYICKINVVVIGQQKLLIPSYQFYERVFYTANNRQTRDILSEGKILNSINLDVNFYFENY